ncbi:MAG TPA: hypothetical protein VGF14_07350 [Alphaproteobacteria bacterium]
MPDPKSAADTQTKTDILSALRTQLVDLLPRAMQCAVASYRHFSNQISPDDAKQFTAFHNACRSALAHVDYLNRLAKWLTATHPQQQDEQDLQPLMQQARQMLLHIEHFDSQPDDNDQHDRDTEF